MDIDLIITDPEGQPYHKEERKSDGRYVFAAAKSGKYRFCFSNKMSSVTPKVLLFSIDINSAHVEPPVKDGEEKGNYIIYIVIDVAAACIHWVNWGKMGRVPMLTNSNYLIN